MCNEQLQLSCRPLACCFLKQILYKNIYLINFYNAWLQIYPCLRPWKKYWCVLLGWRGSPGICCCRIFLEVWGAQGECSDPYCRRDGHWHSCWSLGPPGNQRKGGRPQQDAQGGQGVDPTASLSFLIFSKKCELLLRILSWSAFFNLSFLRVREVKRIRWMGASFYCWFESPCNVLAGHLLMQVR